MELTFATTQAIATREAIVANAVQDTTVASTTQKPSLQFPASTLNHLQLHPFIVSIISIIPTKIMSIKARKSLEKDIIFNQNIKQTTQHHERRSNLLFVMWDSDSYTIATESFKNGTSKKKLIRTSIIVSTSNALCI